MRQTEEKGTFAVRPRPSPENGDQTCFRICFEGVFRRRGMDEGKYIGSAVPHNGAVRRGVYPNRLVAIARSADVTADARKQAAIAKAYPKAFPMVSDGACRLGMLEWRVTRTVWGQGGRLGENGYFLRREMYLPRTIPIRMAQMKEMRGPVNPSITYLERMKDPGPCRGPPDSYPG